MEGEISTKSVNENSSKGIKAAGDLIPWNITEQYGDKDFPRLAGARIVRIATHPNYQRVNDLVFSNFLLLYYISF